MRIRLLATGLLAVTLGCATPARADDTPPAPKADPAPTAEPAVKKTVVKLDIEERLEGQPDKNTPVTLIIREKLRGAGCLVYTEKPLAVDEYERRKREKAAAATGESLTAQPEERPAPDLVLKGKVEINLDRTSKFYGQDVAFVYVSTVALSIRDAEGKELGTVEDRDEWGKTEKAPAQEEAIKRIRVFTAADVLKAEQVRSRLSDAGREEARKFVEKTEKKRTHEAPGEAEKPAGGKKK